MRQCDFRLWQATCLGISCHPCGRLHSVAQCETAPSQCSQAYLMGRAVLFPTLFHIDGSDSNAPFSTFSLVITTAKSVKRSGNTGSQRASLRARANGRLTSRVGLGSRVTVWLQRDRVGVLFEEVADDCAARRAAVDAGRLTFRLPTATYHR